MSILDLEAFDRAPLQRDPCDFIVVPQFVGPEVLAEVNRDYPQIAEPGNFPPEVLGYGPVFAGLLEELASPLVRSKFAAKFDVDLEPLVLQTTVRKYSEPSDGNIHNDSRTKIVTALIYFNENWTHAGGRLRLLRSVNDIEDYAAEVTPEKGTLIAFRRSERSYHGFVPCDAERRSLQMYWVKPKREGRDGRSPGSLKKRIKRLFKRG
ncbi:MAG: 2OG-Fe(II) oxygenase [Rhodospirillales bacterium]|nr:2OG-Fe(II) oxygenase [Rhodospirillales bacterium]